MDGWPGMTASVHFRTGQDEWPTPRWAFEMLDGEFGFDIDLCASPANALRPVYYTREQDALSRGWWLDGQSGYCNPPYSRAAGGIGAFLAKGREAAANGMTVVFLIPARPDTGWWAEHVMQADEVRLLQGRLKFGDGTGNAPFPSCIVVYRPVQRYTVGSVTYTLTPTVRPVFTCLSRERMT